MVKNEKTIKNSKDSEHSKFLEEKLHNSFLLSKKGNLGRTKPTSYKRELENLRTINLDTGKKRIAIFEKMLHRILN